MAACTCGGSRSRRSARRSRSFWKVPSPGRGTRCGPKSPAPRSPCCGCRSPRGGRAPSGSSGSGWRSASPLSRAGSSWPCSGSAAPGGAPRSDDGGDPHHSAHRLWQRRQLRGRGEGRAVVPGARRRTRRHHAPGAAGRCARGAVYPVARLAPVPARERAPGGRGPRRRHRPPRAGGVDRGTLLRRPGQRPAVVSAGGRALRGAADSGRRRAHLPSARRVRAGGGPARPGRATVPRGSSRYRGVPLPAPHHDGTLLIGEVIYVDRFGTLISNIPGDAVEPGVRIKVAGTEIGTLARTFGDVGRGALVAFVGSGGTVEIAVRDGSAARLLGVGVGAEVRA